MLSPSIRNLIFDLGGVILDLSVDDTLTAFATLSKMPKEKAVALFHASQGFVDYEKGLIDDDAFRKFVRETYSLAAPDEQIDKAWNAMLLGIPTQKLELLTRLKGEFNVFLLSNTNNIHLNYINKFLVNGENGNDSLDDYFHQAYYSHRMKKRKPDAEIFEQVLEENRLLPEQTLFLDDSPVNIAGADAVGIKTLHVTTPKLILDYFHA